MTKDDLKAFVLELQSTIQKRDYTINNDNRQIDNLSKTVSVQEKQIKQLKEDLQYLRLAIRT